MHNLSERVTCLFALALQAQESGNIDLFVAMTLQAEGAAARAARPFGVLDNNPFNPPAP